MGLLQAMGYTRVREYHGGIQEWTDAGLAVGKAQGLAKGAADPQRARRPAVQVHSRIGRVLHRLAGSSYATLVGLWFGVVACAASFYWLASLAGPSLMTSSGAPVSPTLRGLVTSLYFSFVTATSVGFGDVVPVGASRIVAVAEAVTGLLVFGCVISKIVSHRQEELLEEIHRLSFEGRLGRLRTNLHLVLSELQVIAAEPDGPRERLVTRLESAARILSGELRSLHDLLYRPQSIPEESVLESLLASMAASLRELAAILDGCDGGGSSETLRADLEAIKRLAGEICGECVPREYAPSLKVWMDRIQQAAWGLAD